MVQLAANFINIKNNYFQIATADLGNCKEPETFISFPIRKTEELNHYLISNSLITKSF